MNKKSEKKIKIKDLASIYDFSILREFRKRKSYTITELSKNSGVPVSTISKLERNKCFAELTTLVRLSSSFGIEASELLRAAERKYSDRKRAYIKKKGKLKYEEVSYPNIRVAIIEAKKGEEIFRPEIHRDDYELCWVRKGKIKLFIGRVEEVLTNGDCAQFDASLEHSYKAFESSEILIVHLAKEKKY
ncbi:MAG TPA: helix-turn-helix domain-containing protein [Victivallales bacterium]|nr:helix-turn-helix domain-containing protein [Victivallales bacterium]HPO91335.1 helix-turn-helix domain-containing protein [Victivallales bacterium]HRR05917.1 helix-turn-helix domain-containing protein [Victivallales bacterium]HRR28372.1 helix-turn-helix domain-containing protein [Victivallales bacterium]HRU00166.1 helix-turn-helix domain-containing protein [Victivallales bacterium]